MRLLCVNYTGKLSIERWYTLFSLYLLAGMGLCLYVDLCICAIIPTLLHTFWHAIIHLFLHFKVFIFLFLYFLMLVSVTVRPNGGSSISGAPDGTERLVAAATLKNISFKHVTTTLELSSCSKHVICQPESYKGSTTLHVVLVSMTLSQYQTCDIQVN